MTPPRNAQAKAYATRRNVPQADSLSGRDQWRTFWRNTAQLVDNKPFEDSAKEYGHAAKWAMVVQIMKDMAE